MWYATAPQRLEFEWLLADELPIVFMQLGRLLKNAVQVFNLNKAN